MDQLVEEGFVVLGGPIGNGENAMVIVEAADENEVKSRLAEDPWLVDGILEIGALEAWTIWLDGRWLAVAR
jgi:uncharacterized protein YciI